MRKNLIFGGLGQDGRLLSQNLISKNEKVLAVVNTTIISRQLHGVNYVSISDPNIENYSKILTDFGPDVIYNFASLSSVAASQESPNKSFKINFELILMIMSAIEDYLQKTPGKHLKLVHAGSSEMFGESASPVNESSPMRPRTLYGEHKKLAFDYLESQKGRFTNFEISNLLLFNHESILRPEYFVSQKIATAAASWKTQNLLAIKFGNIDIERDWGCAREYVEAIRLIGSQLSSENYVIASGQLVRVRDILEHAMTYVGNDNSDLNNYLDLGLFRQVETAPLVGDSTKIGKSLGWKATRSIFSVIEEMIDNQIRNLGE
jgi:GDPmannose 4,6-dehydratase